MGKREKGEDACTEESVESMTYCKSCIYSVKDCRGTELKFVKEKKEKEKRDRNWEAFFVLLRGLRYAPRF